MEEDEINPLVEMPAYKPQWSVAETLGQKRIREEAETASGVNDPSLSQNVDTLGKAFLYGDNFGVQVAKQMDRIGSSGPADPAWSKDRDEWIKQQTDIPEDQQWRYKLTRNRTEAEVTKADAAVQEREQEILSRRTGVGNFTARMLAGIVDVDAPLTFMTGGVGAAGKAGILATRAGRLATGAAIGGVVGAGLGVVGYEADPTADWQMIPAMGLMGIAFGGAGAAVGMAARGKAIDEFGETVLDGAPRAAEDIRKESFVNDDPYHSESGVRAEEARIKEEVAAAKAPPEVQGETKAQPKTFSLDDLDETSADSVIDVRGGNSSIGAKQIANTGPGVASISNTRLQDRIQTARTRVRQLGIATEWLDGWQNLQGAKSAIGRQVERFHNAVNSTPLSSDFARLMNSGSAVAQNLAYDAFENAAGIIRNGRSAARIQEHYYKQTLSRFMPFEEGYSEYAAQQGAGFFRRNYDTELRNKFNREVTAELQARMYDGKGNTSNPTVKKAADAIDNTFANEVDISTGRPGETGIKGSERLVKQSGYMPQKWLGRNMRRLIESGKHSKDDITFAIAEGYRKQYPFMTNKDADIYAKAVVNRAEKFDEGINTNLIGMLNGDGRSMLVDMLERNGMPAKEIEKFIERMTGAMEERGAAGHTKARVDIDLRHASSNGVNIMDLVDTDFQSMIPARIRRTSGQAALARKGVASKQDWDEIVDSILEEQRANGTPNLTGTSLADRVDDLVNKDKHLDREFLDGLYTYFNGQPVAGGISPIYSRMKKLTNLALLNQLGLTQIAELGPTIATMGWSNFKRGLPEAIQGELKKADSPLVQELKHYSIFVPEENLFRDDLVFEFEKQTTQNEYARGADRLLNKAQRLQGYTSGFYGMRRIQQRLAVTLGADKLAKHFRDGGLISDERLMDMGLNNKDVAKLKTYVDNGTVAFDAQGNLQKLNLSQWSADDADLFAMTMNQQMNTLVQKAMAGESSMIFHKDGMASLFFHLKSFPLLAMEKQLLRNTRFMDAEAAQTFMYGLATAGLAYSARQVVNGREENLTAEKIVKGAFGYSNMTGWVPMWTDPLAGMLGLDSLQVGGYAGIGNSVISIPATLTTLDRMAQLPQAVLSGADLELSKGDVNAMTALPIIGNLYGFAYMFNKMKESIGEREALKRKNKKQNNTITENVDPGLIMSEVTGL